MSMARIGERTTVTPAFFESNGNLFVQRAKGVIDVSEWQGDIDWAKAKSAGVEGAIIRISYGWGNGYDKKALRNISECKRLGIPFGIYMYSYAENSGNAASEGADVASLLRKAGVNPNDLQYPVYYDLEAWSWTGHAHPTSPAVYDGIVNAWFSQLRNAGYSNLAVYSYTSYLNNELNSSDIHAKTRWVAQYGSRMGYTAWSSNDRGWQYSSSAHINGISGSVDVNAFGASRKPTVRKHPLMFAHCRLSLFLMGTITSMCDPKWQAALIFLERARLIPQPSSCTPVTVPKRSSSDSLSSQMEATALPM